MGRHALLSASSSHRWLACPPSARLCENYEDTGSEYAQQGTDAHSLCEHKLKLSLGMETTDPTAGLFFYDEEMEECACGYAEYVTGVMCAAADKELSSEVGFRGIAKKVLIFLLVGIANTLDVQVIGSGSVLRTAVIFFYISNEGVSLLENAGHLGLPIPEKLKDILAQLHDRAESGKGDE